MPKELDNKCGSRIKAIREALGLMQKDFAKRLDISSPSLSELENNKYYPGFELLAKLYEDFNASVYYIMFGIGDKFVNPIHASMQRVSEFAVNKKDVEEFLYNFEHSTILQYYIMTSYKSKMMTDGTAILKELDEKNLQTESE